MQVHPSRRKAIAKRILAWYADNARDLPWRRTRDPYRIWVSEIMLQQTRVEAVLSYYERWLDAFPTLAELAAASQQRVLQLWEGLGYYSRARNLHRAAQIVCAEHGGRLPNTAEDLRQLPGIGRYTAGAIASIAFGERAPVVDGNIKRVFARVFNLELDIRSPVTEKFLWDIAAQLVPAKSAGDFNQALMELGARVCIPNVPRCNLCPLKGICHAQKLGVQLERPVRGEKAVLPSYIEIVAVLRWNGRVLLIQRPPDGLLGGMWRFPGDRIKGSKNAASFLQNEIARNFGIRIKVGARIQTVQHAYTHFKVTVHAHECALSSTKPPSDTLPNSHWARAADLAAFPMGKVDRQIAQAISNL